MNCNDVEKEINNNLIEDNSFISDEAKEHINKCQSCSANADSAKKIAASFAAMKESKLPDNFHSSLMDNIKASQPAKKPVYFRRYAYMAASLLVLIVAIAVIRLPFVNKADKGVDEDMLSVDKYAVPETKEDANEEKVTAAKEAKAVEDKKEESIYDNEKSKHSAKKEASYFGNDSDNVKEEDKVETTAPQLAAVGQNPTEKAGDTADQTEKAPDTTQASVNVSETVSEQVTVTELAVSENTGIGGELSVGVSAPSDYKFLKEFTISSGITGEVVTLTLEETLVLKRLMAMGANLSDEEGPIAKNANNTITFKDGDEERVLHFWYLDDVKSDDRYAKIVVDGTIKQVNMRFYKKLEEIANKYNLNLNSQ